LGFLEFFGRFRPVLGFRLQTGTYYRRCREAGRRHWGAGPAAWRWQLRFPGSLADSLTGLIVAAPLSALKPTALTRDQQAEFPRPRIVSHRNIPKGVTHPIRLTLTDGTLTHDAAFSSINETKPVMKFADGRTELNFVDSYKYTVAAYQVGQLLGLDDMMPVAVARLIDHEMGSLTWWVDGVQFDEGDRVNERNRRIRRLGRQMCRMRVFRNWSPAGTRPDEPAHHQEWALDIDFTKRSASKGDRLARVTRCDRLLAPCRPDGR
jgi:hypothetical protein